MIMLLVGVVGYAQAEDFRKLSGAQIRAKLVGMQLTDESHWIEAFEPGGKLTSIEMGRMRTGQWHINKDQLCESYSKSEDKNCYDVWISGRTVQMRSQGSTVSPFEGVLERITKRR